MNNKRLLNFIIIEVLLLIGIIIFSIGTYYTILYIFLLFTPMILIFWAGILEINYERKNPHLLLLSIVIYTIIALNSYLMIDDNVIWNGFFSRPSSIIHDEGVTDFIYIATLFLLLLSSVFYEAYMYLTRKN